MNGLTMVSATISMIFLVIGGCMLDSRDMTVPVALIILGLVWAAFAIVMEDLEW